MPELASEENSESNNVEVYQPAPKGKIIVAEDNMANMQVLKQLLE